MPRAKKRCYQIDLHTGDIIAEFNSVREAQIKTGVSHSVIGSCCRGVSPSGRGFAWSYEENLNATRAAINAPKEKVSEAEAVAMLQKYQNSLSYNDLSRKTGYTYEELRELYDKHKIYRLACDEDD